MLRSPFNPLIPFRYLWNSFRALLSIISQTLAWMYSRTRFGPRAPVRAKNPGSKVLTQFAVGVRFSSLNTVALNKARRTTQRLINLLNSGNELIWAWEQFKFYWEGPGGDIDREFSDEKTVFVLKSPESLDSGAWKMIVVFTRSHYLLSILYILLG